MNTLRQAVLIYDLRLMPQSSIISKSTISSCESVVC